jgi:phage repressor protein C with HTH and peptisase S24 domain
MEPTFRDGDYVLFVANGEYRPNDVWVKRLKEKEGRKFLTSDNLAYPAIELNEYYRIIGKVVTVWRNIKF